MQLDGATDVEKRIYDVCLRVERELPASGLATTISMTLSEAGNELQRLRRAGGDATRQSHQVDAGDVQAGQRIGYDPRQLSRVLGMGRDGEVVHLRIRDWRGDERTLTYHHRDELTVWA